jgi:putative ABC transport system permease protein
MGRVAWRKVRRDLWLTRGRTALLIATVAVSLTSLGTVLGAYAIVSREMRPSYLSTNPAAATVVLDRGADADLLAAVRQRPDIAGAEARAMVRARVEIAPDAWLPLDLFVVPDFDAMRIETFAREEGAWPPPTGAMLLERTALPVLNAEVGRELTVQTPNSPARSVRVAGVVRDPGLAPAWQEQTGYAYITPETLAWLGESGGLDLLKIAVADRPFDAAAIERTARALSAWLAQNGWTVEEIRIPPPGVHPHQRLTQALTLVLLLFSLFALGLSAILVATLISGMLARQVRQIGAMNAIGARPAQVAAIYAATVFAIGMAAAALSLPPTGALGALLAGAFADLSNITLVSSAVPTWVFLVNAVAGVGLPLLAAAVPIARASRLTVREAIGDVGLYRAPTGGALLGARISRAVGPTLALAGRSAFRRPGRLVLSLALLTAGGATFLSGVNVAAASDRQMAAAEARRAFDLELHLTRPVPTDVLLRIARAAPGVAAVEPIGYAQVAVVVPGEAPLVQTYKDGGHGSLPLWALPPTEPRVPPRMIAGRWLQPGDTDALVLAPGALDRPDPALGDTVVLALDGKTTRWRVVGVVQGEGLGGQVGLFVSLDGFAQAAGHPGATQALRVVTTARDAAGREATLRALERDLTAAGVGVAEDLNVDRLNLALRNHVAIVQGALQFLGLVMGAVGAVTLAAAISTSVVERTREFGVLQTLGATPARVTGVVVAEGVLLGALSWLGAVVLGAALSVGVGAVIGQWLFRTPLPLVMPAAGLGAWLAIALLGSAAAAAYPARAAARLTIREALAYL